jgi:hypothetical protein
MFFSENRPTEGHMEFKRKMIWPYIFFQQSLAQITWFLNSHESASLSSGAAITYTRHEGAKITCFLFTNRKKGHNMM